MEFALYKSLLLLLLLLIIILLDTSLDEVFHICHITGKKVQPNGDYAKALEYIDYVPSDTKTFAFELD